MRYEVVDRRITKGQTAFDTCYLVRNNWDDFGFKTLFEVVLFDEKAQRHDLGTARIMESDMVRGFAQLPKAFSSLSDRFCSLGGGREYYIELSTLPLDLRRRLLMALRDCVHDPTIFHAFREQNAMQTSLLRDVSVRDVLHRYPRILRGDADLTPYRFWFEFTGEGESKVQRCEFNVSPDSRPPTNIHVIIGPNGVGKTRLLAGMADALTNNQAASIGIPGQFTFDSSESGSSDFLNLVIVSFSAFDRFEPIPGGSARTATTLPYYYVGIKTNDTVTLNARRVRIKAPGDLDAEFASSMANVAMDPLRLERWLDAMSIVSSDPGINEIDISSIFGSGAIDEAVKVMAASFAQMSSGHKIVLLTLTRLVEFISDRSLVLMDEPETHLHPPLLGSFVRAVSNLLVSRNAVAIVATHSPVVLQEVPASCVSMLMRSGRDLRVLRPEDETFAENVSFLTRRVFGLEIERSGFYKLLKEAAHDRTYESVVNLFGKQIGSEGRALTRAFIAKGE